MSNKNIFRLLLITTGLILVGWLCSCGSSSKNKRSLTASIDSTIIKEKENLIRDAREKIAYLENELRQNQLTNFQFNDCDTAAWSELILAIRRSSASLTKTTADSLIWVVEAMNKKYSSSVKFFADGSAEASGALRSANQARSALQKQLTIYMDKSDSLAYELENEKKNVKVDIKEAEKQKETKRGVPWWIFVLLFIAGVITGVRYSKQIKSFISKIKP